MSTFPEIDGGFSPVIKHSGGKYQYVPTPYEVNSNFELSSSKILHKPKSVNLISF